MKYSLIFLLVILTISRSNGQTNPAKNKGMYYFGQDDPGLTPKVFAPGFISKPDVYEFGSIFSQDKTEFFFAIDDHGKSEILYSKLQNGAWSDPKVIITHPRFGHNDPMLSPDEQRLYFISDRALDGEGRQKDYDIWYVERKASGWSAPINAGKHINSSANEYYMAFTDDGAMYFSSNKRADQAQNNNFDIYKSAQVKGEFQPATKLGAGVNTPNYEADVFVAGDESYVIFCSTREDGYGRGDLYISFKKRDGTWTESKNMGDKINTPGHQLCPFVSKDGKYLFYTSEKEIYWVNADIIDRFRED